MTVQASYLRTATFLFLGVACLHSTFAQIPAFPGAVGPGRFATGGRGGDAVIAVTNLNDGGPGSLRAALTTARARFVIFKTGGVVNLLSPIAVTEDSLTIFGETAPGDGILITGDYIIFDAPNLVISGLRLRPGDAVGGSHSDPNDRDGVYFKSAADNWIMSHCSVGWGQDVGGISIWTSTTPPGYPGSENWTIQDCLVSEPLNDNAHPKGPHSDGFNIARARNGLVYNVIVGHSNARNVQVQGPAVPGANHEIRNYLLYNWKDAAIEAEGTVQLWLSNSRFILGLDKGTDTNAVTITALTAGSKLYLSRIIAPKRTSDSGDNWVVTNNPPSSRIYEASYEPFAGSALRERYVLDDLRENLLLTAGAILPKRDPVDSAFIQDVRNGTGRIKDVVGPVPKQIRWPQGFEVVSATDNQIVYTDPTASVTPGRYNGDTLHITAGAGVGQKRAIISTSRDTTSVTLTYTGLPFNPQPNTTSDFDIILTYSSATPATQSVPTLLVGTAPADDDGDLLPNAIETLIGTNPNSSTGEEGALGDKDNDGYVNIEEWVILLYDYQKEKLLKR
jgi:hypothetical protein